MAYLKELKELCLRCKKKQAVVLLVDWRNEERGHFCRQCGEKALKDRQAYESGNPNQIRS